MCMRSDGNGPRTSCWRPPTPVFAALPTPDAFPAILEMDSAAGERTEDQALRNRRAQQTFRRRKKAGLPIRRTKRGDQRKPRSENKRIGSRQGLSIDTSSLPMAQDSSASHSLDLSASGFSHDMPALPGPKPRSLATISSPHKPTLLPSQSASGRVSFGQEPAQSVIEPSQLRLTPSQRPSGTLELEPIISQTTPGLPLAQPGQYQYTSGVASSTSDPSTFSPRPDGMEAPQYQPLDSTPLTAPSLDTPFLLAPMQSGRSANITTGPQPESRDAFAIQASDPGCSISMSPIAGEFLLACGACYVN